MNGKEKRRKEKKRNKVGSLSTKWGYVTLVGRRKMGGEFDPIFPKTGFVTVSRAWKNEME